MTDTGGNSHQAAISLLCGILCLSNDNIFSPAYIFLNREFPLRFLIIHHLRLTNQSVWTQWQHLLIQQVGSWRPGRSCQPYVDPEFLANGPRENCKKPLPCSGRPAFSSVYGNGKDVTAETKYFELMTQFQCQINFGKSQQSPFTLWLRIVTIDAPNCS